ncbi:MAG TPA: sigma 54-interacting transcriptional regulator [Terriglobales bacterium]|jgi:formate hydrogenlyase transcriptional activator|nr:sigma 54-interacting transcriptional regulator [Terriglobales bacterium]
MAPAGRDTSLPNQPERELQWFSPGQEHYEALVEVSHSIASHPELAGLFHDLLQRLQRVLRFDLLNLVLHDPATNLMRLNVLEATLPVTVPLSLALPVEDIPAGWVWQHQQPLLIRNLEEETRFAAAVRMYLESGLRSYYVLPLTTPQRRAGAISFGSAIVDAFGDSDLRLMREAAEQIAVAVDNVLTHESAVSFQQQLAMERDRLRMLLEINNAIVSHLELRELFSSISAAMRRAFRHDYSSLSLYDAEQNHFEIRAVDLPNGRGLIREGMTFGFGTPAARAFATRKPLLVSRLDPETFPSEIIRLVVAEGMRSGCWLPLVSRDRVLGTLNVLSRRENAFTQEDLELLRQVANQVAIAVDNGLAFHQIAELKDKLAEEKLYLEDEIRSQYNFEEIIGESVVWKRVLEQVETVAPTDSSVLILGETGTGKELIARAIHNLSGRRERTFVKLNCAAIPTGLLESELFGHEKGAFTGAISQKVGRVELADHGTLFLDEVGDIPPELQPKLLRVLQEREFERLGSTRTMRVDLRLIAATNRDLGRMVAERQFRSDLFYRLNVFPIQLPALRERGKDIALLVRYFAQKHASSKGKHIERIPAETMQALERWHWPGNVRELENLIERAVILTRGTVLNVPLAEFKSGPETAPPPDDVATLEDAERDHILKALREARGLISGPQGAAARLGLKRTTLNSKMRKLGITRKDYS